MISLNHIDDGKSFDFSNISGEYAKYRDVYPKQFFDRINALGLCSAGMNVLDLGTGTGVLPRHLVGGGAQFTGADISAAQIAEAKRLSEGQNIEYLVSPAEKLDFPDQTFDTVLACMCFTYFDKKILLPRLYNMIKDNGRFAIMSLVWLPGDSDIAQESERIILKYNPVWNGVGYKRPIFDENGIPTTYNVDTSLFEVDTSFAFDVTIPFSRDTWHGRMKATRGLASSSLTQEQIAAFDEEHQSFLAAQPETFDVLHSATFCILKKRL